MPNSERYTEAQKNLLKIKTDDLTEEEKRVLKIALLPRKRYVPQTEEEGMSLAEDMLGHEMYLNFVVLADEIRASYRCTTKWTGSNRWWRQCYNFYCDKFFLCAIAMDVNTYSLQIEFGERECRLFEAARRSFPREEVQWIFDCAPWRNGKKLLQFDPEKFYSFELLFRLLAIRRIPDVDHFSDHYDFFKK